MADRVAATLYAASNPAFRARFYGFSPAGETC